MKSILSALGKIKLPGLPTLGIFAFALASTWALFQFFNSVAVHPTWLYWIPAALVEIVTAWLTKHAVEAVYQITRSARTNNEKADKRFFWIVAIVSAVLCIPTFAASIQANLYEFGGAWALALLFPVAVIGCAIGAQIPRSVSQHTAAKDDEARAELRSVKKELREGKHELRRLRSIEEKMRETEDSLVDALREIEQGRAELAQVRADNADQVDETARSLRAELEQTRAELAQRAQMKDHDRAAYEKICAGLTDDLPTTAREVNRLLNDHGYYAAPDRTAASWIK